MRRYSQDEPATTRSRSRSSFAASDVRRERRRPLIVMSESAAASWNGAFDSAGAAIYEKAPCDYDRACAESFGLIDSVR